MHDTHISDVILPIFADNHKLTFPELLVIRDLIVASLTFAHFKDSRIT
jgi:hypothetical protein